MAKAPARKPGRAVFYGHDMALKKTQFEIGLDSVEWSKKGYWFVLMQFLSPQTMNVEAIEVFSERGTPMGMQWAGHAFIDYPAHLRADSPVLMSLSVSPLTTLDMP